MSDPYVVANIPIVRQLATLLDWALVGHVVLAGVSVYFAWRAGQLASRVRELEDTVTRLEAERRNIPQSSHTSLGPLSDDRQIPPISFPSE
jgi:outer membrane murein-binding lipoprotein Lpp